MMYNRYDKDGKFIESSEDIGYLDNMVWELGNGYILGSKGQFAGGFFEDWNK